MSYCLYIDASLSGIALGLQKNDYKNSELVGFEICQDRFGSFNFINENVKNLTDSAGIQLGDINRFVCSVGPGSFTGIRVGLAWLYGFVAQLKEDAQILALSSLECLAESYSKRSKGKKTVFIFPSTKRHGYVACYEEGRNSSALIDLNEKPQKVFDGAQIYIVDQWANMETYLTSISQKFVCLSRDILFEEALNAMVQIAAQRTGEFSNRLPQANYLRPSSVEEKLLAQTNSN